MHMQSQGTPHVTPTLVIRRVDHESAGRPLGIHVRKCGVGSRWSAGLGGWTSHSEWNYRFAYLAGDITRTKGKK